MGRVGGSGMPAVATRSAGDVNVALVDFAVAVIVSAPVTRLSRIGTCWKKVPESPAGERPRASNDAAT